MARFARDCRKAMDQVTTQLEVTLGPDTGDLKVSCSNIRVERDVLY
jgi:hypothetical protein